MKADVGGERVVHVQRGGFLPADAFGLLDLADGQGLPWLDAGDAISRGLPEYKLTKTERF